MPARRYPGAKTLAWIEETLCLSGAQGLPGGNP
jgi:hypothetical protein